MKGAARVARIKQILNAARRSSYQTIRCEMNERIQRLRPGKHFIGLWVYRQHGYRSRKPRWVVTLFDHNNEYWETPLRDSPMAALREAEKILRSKP